MAAAHGLEPCVLGREGSNPSRRTHAWKVGRAVRRRFAKPRSRPRVARWFDPSTFRARMAGRAGKAPGWKPEVTAQAVGRFESCAIRSGGAAMWRGNPIRNRLSAEKRSIGPTPISSAEDHVDGR